MQYWRIKWLLTNIEMSQKYIFYLFGMGLWRRVLSCINTNVCYWIFLKVPKCEIFDGSDCHDFYTIKSPRVVDFGVKINNFIKYSRVHLGPQSSLRVCSLLSLIFRTKISFRVLPTNLVGWAFETICLFNKDFLFFIIF